MPPPRQHCLARFAAFCRFLALVLALAGQIAGNAAAGPAPDSQSPAAQLRAAMVLCLGSAKPAKQSQHPARHHLPDLAIAGTLHAFAHHAALDATETFLPPPAVARRAAWAGLPQARAPPARFARATYPTGPPTSLI